MTNTAENNKRIAKNTLLLYFRMLLTMVVSLYTSRIVLSTLGINDFGIYNVVGGFVTMFAVISGAMTTATQRFISFEIGKKEKGNITTLFSTAVIIHLILGGIILFLAETIGLYFLNNYMNFPEDRYIAANWVYQFSILTFIINVISVPYNAAIVAYEHMKAFAYVSIIEVTLKLLIVYLLIISPIDKLIFYSLLLAITAITIRFIYGWYCSKHFKECRTTWIFNHEYGKNMFAFVGWNLIGSIAGIAKEQGINVVLNIFFGAAINAARGIAYQVNGALNSFVSNFQLAMNPQIVKSFSVGDFSKMHSFIYLGSKISFFILYYVQKIYGRSEYFGVFTQYTHCEYTRYSVLFFQFYLYIVFICKYILFYCSTIQTRCIFISQDTISYEKQKKPRSNKLQNFSFIVFCCCKGIL